MVAAMFPEESPPRLKTTATRPIAMIVRRNMSVEIDAISGLKDAFTDEKT